MLVTTDINFTEENLAEYLLIVAEIMHSIDRNKTISFETKVFVYNMFVEKYTELINYLKEKEEDND